MVSAPCYTHCGQSIYCGMADPLAFIKQLRSKLFAGRGFSGLSPSVSSGSAETSDAADGDGSASAGDDNNNHATLSQMATTDATRGRLHRMRDFDPDSPPGSSVPDPYYGGERGFEDVLDICQRACAGLLEAIQAGST